MRASSRMVDHENLWYGIPATNIIAVCMIVGETFV